MRLSFRLSEDEVEIWQRLRARHPGKKDSYIFHEIMRREGFRMAGHTKEDTLAELIKITKSTLREVREMRRGSDDTENSDEAEASSRSESF